MWTLAQNAGTADTVHTLVNRLTDTGTITMILIFGIPIIAIVVGGLRSIMVGRAKERTRQEIAAYVAEGSMTAEEGERLLTAKSKCD